MPASSRRRALPALIRTVLVVALGAFCVPASAHAAGTITATAGSTRSVIDTDTGYANALAGVGFEKAVWVSDPATASWSALCTTSASGACTSASLANGHYLVRETSAGAPSGWRALTRLAWGGAASGAISARDYVGDVTVTSGSAVAVRPSTTWSPTSPSSGSGSFVAARNNPAPPAQCGLDVLLLLDRSGSITAQRDTYKAAAQQLVNTLSGTPTRMKIFSFAQGATANQNSFLDLSVPADVATANSVINAVYAGTGGATNWDAGMKLAAGAAVDSVIFVTDGNPTQRDSTTNGANADGGTTVDLLDLTAGIASANKVKTEGKSGGPVLAAGATILGVGVGTGVRVEPRGGLRADGEHRLLHVQRRRARRPAAADRQPALRRPHPRPQARRRSRWRRREGRLGDRCGQARRIARRVHAGVADDDRAARRRRHQRRLDPGGRRREHHRQGDPEERLRVHRLRLPEGQLLVTSLRWLDDGDDRHAAPQRGLVLHVSRLAHRPAHRQAADAPVRRPDVLRIHDDRDRRRHVLARRRRHRIALRRCGHLHRDPDRHDRLGAHRPDLRRRQQHDRRRHGDLPHRARRDRDLHVHEHEERARRRQATDTSQRRPRELRVHDDGHGRRRVLARRRRHRDALRGARHLQHVPDREDRLGAHRPDLRRREQHRRPAQRHRDLPGRRGRDGHLHLHEHEERARRRQAADTSQRRPRELRLHKRRGQILA